VASQGREDELLHLQSTLLRSAEAVATTEQAPTSSWVASDIAVGGSRVTAGRASSSYRRQAARRMLHARVKMSSISSRKTAAVALYPTVGARLQLSSAGALS
jgi:hypothetical protein